MESFQLPKISQTWQCVFKIDEKLYTNILIYFIGYITIKKDLKGHRVNPLYLLFRYVNGYFEEINENRYLTLVLFNESKEKIRKYEEME